MTSGDKLVFESGSLIAGEMRKRRELEVGEVFPADLARLREENARLRAIVDRFRSNTMNAKTKPDWWPECPYAIDVFQMTFAEYCQAVPNEETRTAISGCLGRYFWKLASDAIWHEFSSQIPKEPLK